MSLKIGIVADPSSPTMLEYVCDAERLGVDSVWTPEFWGYDAFTPLAAIAARTSRITLGTAIAQLGARTPAMLAMSAMSVQALSGGRFILGIGTSGPQVMEGWHGLDFARPLQRTRETIDIVRLIASGQKVAYDGSIYQLPLPESSGVALRSRATPVHVPIYIASLGPANLALTGEKADGWIGNSFLPEHAEVFLDPIRSAAVAAGRDPSDIALTVTVSVEFTDDVLEAGRRHADGYAFTFGAMGSRATNFYNDAFARQGYGDDVREVQRLWLSGDRAAAAARVPIEIGMRTNLIGTPAMILDRLRLYQSCGVTTLRVNPVASTDPDRLEALAHLLDLTRTL